MLKLFTPEWVRNILLQVNEQSDDQLLKHLHSKLVRFNCTEAEISIVIPVWNENIKIIPTLLSLAEQKTTKKVELIIVNNNSTDNTQHILDASGVKTVFQSVQGISFARQLGLQTASGTFHLCADADSLYPPNWVDEMTNPLHNKLISCVYGKYSFIPVGNLNRFGLALFEAIANTLFVLRKKRKEYLNIMGFNFAFRKEDGLKVGGFNTTRQKWSDGWMGMELAQNGLIKRVVKKNALVWTNPRRLIIDGGLFKSFAKRLIKEIKVLKEYFVA